MLSQIESGKVNPTLVTLWKASYALGVDIPVLIDGKRREAENFHLLRGTEQAKIICEKGVEFKILSAPGIPERLEMYLLKMAPGSIHRSEPHESGCCEYILLTHGSVRASSGKNSTLLETGDFLSYRGDLPHSLENTGPDEAVLHMTDFSETN